MLNENQEQTRKLALGCSKPCFEVVDKAKLMWFEEIFEEYKKILVSQSQISWPFLTNVVYYERKVNKILTWTLMLNENQEQTRKLALGCSKHGFEIVDKAKLM